METECKYNIELFETLKKNLSKMYDDTVFTVNDLGSRPRHAKKVKSYNLIKFCEKIN